MEDFDLSTVAGKSVRGIFALISRTALIYLLNIITNLILWAYLDPASYGLFFVVSSIITFLTYFQDIGLAASLIQKREEPTREELRIAFTIQQLLVLAIIIPSFIFSKQIGEFYKLNQAGLYLFYGFLFSFFLSSLRTIPTVILERHLNFHKLIVPQIFENVVYNIALIYLVISGYGITSFTIAILARSIVGLILTYIIQSWPIGLSFNINTSKRLVSFGLPFQANSILAFIKDDLLNIYLGKILPFSQVGFIGFSKKVSFLPSSLIMDNVIKITFPSYSRLQHDKEALKKLVEKSIFSIAFFIFPMMIAIIMFTPFLIDFVPKYNKWSPTTTSILFFSLNILFASITVPLTNFLNAIGKVKTTLYFMIFLTVLTWGLTPLLIKILGFNGVSIASFIVSASLLTIVPVIKRYIDFSFIKSIYKQAIATVLLFIFIFLTKGIITSLPFLVLDMILSAIFYLTVVYMFTKDELLNTLRFALSAIKNK